jgi:hypothetical protein
MTTGPIYLLSLSSKLCLSAGIVHQQTVVLVLATISSYQSLVLPTT